MPSEPANLDGLEGLIDRQYALSIAEGHLVVNDVWYLGADGNLLKGKLAAPLNEITPTKLGAPKNHQMYWSGSDPHYVGGEPVPLLGNGGAVDITIGGERYVRHLSNKPPEGFATYEALVEHYVALLSGPAEQVHGVTARTGATYDVPEDRSPFKIRDTFSARAEITDLNVRLAEDDVAIIGLGGSGAFVLDFLAKTPVAAIRAFDFDTFKVHNAFRSPGAVDIEDFGHQKTEVYRRKYEPFRHRLTFESRQIGRDNAALFDGVTFAFVCIDDGEARAEICDLLLKLGIPFIDVGMGVEKENGVLDGLIRTTLFTSDTADKAKTGVPFDKVDNEAGAYRKFVQIAELNAVNAALAVIRYKQFRGFYTDDNGYYETLLSLGLSRLEGKA